MKTTKKFFALLLSFALMVSMFTANAPVSAEATAPTGIITVTLRVEDSDKTLIPSTQITLTQAEIEKVNQTFNASVETPVLETESVTAAHALAKYVSDTSGTPTEDLAFSYGNPSYLKGQSELDGSYWSYRVNNTTPTAPDGITQYNFTECPIKDGDNIVIFRQAYSAEGYTYYSYFDQEQYETTVNNKLTLVYSKEGYDSSWNMVTGPAASETISVENGTGLVKTGITDENGSIELSFDTAGTYTISSGRLDANGVPVNSRAYATITVKGNTPDVPDTPASSSSPAAPSSAPAQPTVTPSDKPLSTKAPGKASVKKPSAPKKLKAKIKGKKVTVSWKKVKTAKGYVVSVSKKNKKNFKTFATAKKNRFTKKFKKGTYFVKVRSYKKADGKRVYSKYSKTISFKVK